MGLTRSAFGTPYSLGGDDFGFEERKNASQKLCEVYLKDKQKVERSLSIGIGLEPRAIMELLSDIIINHTSDTYKWPNYETARLTAKRYEAVYQECLGIDQFRFLQAGLLLRSMIYHQQPPNEQFVASPLDEPAEQELWKIGEFLYQTQLDMSSIFSEKCQSEYRNLFSSGDA